MNQLSNLRASFSSSKSRPLIPSSPPEPQKRVPRLGKRSRVLTLPLENPQKIGLRRTKQQTIEQTGSPLFKLPPEIREQIWRKVLGGRCVAQDATGIYIGTCAEAWPVWEKVGGEWRGLKPWSWNTGKPKKFISVLLTCRVIYSEAIHLLYSANLFYFRNPFTNWSFSTWHILPTRLAQICILVLDETIGDPSLVFRNHKRWERVWRTLAKMPRLRALYLNVDTLYPKAWTLDLERKLLSPLQAMEQVLNLKVFVKWCEPHGTEDLGIEPKGRLAESLVRVGDYENLATFYDQVPEAVIREWIVRKLQLLDNGTRVEASGPRTGAAIRPIGKTGEPDF